jgi:tRNA-dihydrouridine synthase
MTGRAAVREPWLVAQARAMEAGGAIGPVNLEAAGLRFLDLLARYQPPEFHLSRARRFFAYYGDNVIWAHYLKTLLNRETTLSSIAGVFSAYFREHPEERIAVK